MAKSTHSVSSFARSVLDVVDRIPQGRVMSYGAIADQVGGSARSVGGVLSAWSEETNWHRVVYADGTPASCHGNSASGLLIDEEVPLLNGRVDLTRARWPDNGR
ncbi:MGMT family protein [Rhodococcus sp. NPDC058521]|uniref:MGMT family protein n=1 Tax=Rhodococcus sp. NPDC058521 TaxID=3346536 RepID=UPI00364FC565